jgi:phosphomannomutase
MNNTTKETHKPHTAVLSIQLEVHSLLETGECSGKVVSRDVLKDYEMRKQTNLKTGEVTEIELPKSDVLQFVTEDGSVISARPSGTEPKIKFYCSVKGKLASKADFDAVSAQLDAKIDAVMKDLGVA